MMAAPFAVLFVYAWATMGWWIPVVIYSGTAVLIGWIMVAIEFMTGD